MQMISENTEGVANKATVSKVNIIPLETVALKHKL